RREDGRCVGAKTRICSGTHDAAMAEATGILEALYFVEQNILSNNMIDQLDAANIVHALNHQKFPITNWGKIARTCSRVCTRLNSVCTRLNSVSVSWVNRKGNQAAHALARWTLIGPGPLPFLCVF
ncbi:cytochrome P450, partial [Trifolium medium]|nr:cytochrome P450 [Trifolium medium]